MKSILFKTFNLSLNQYLDLIGYLRAFPYSNETGEGVQVLEEGSDYLRCTYCYEVISYQNTYNPETSEFSKIQIKKIELVPFIIDLQYKTLDVIGNKQKCTKVIEMIGRLTKYKVAIGDNQVNPIKVLCACKEKGVTYLVNRIKIEDYTFFDNIVGNCVLNTADYDKTEELLSKFEKKIVNFSVMLFIDENYSVTFYKSGAITIYKDFEEIDIDLIRILKKGL